MSGRKSVVVAMVWGMLVVRAAGAETSCRFQQLTELSPFALNLVVGEVDDGAVAFSVAWADLTGANKDMSQEVFVTDGSTMRQVTDSPDDSGVGLARFEGPRLDGEAVAFEANADLTGGNPSRRKELYLHDGSKIFQLTDIDMAYRDYSLDRDRVAYSEGFEDAIFLFENGRARPISASGIGAFSLSLDGNAVAFSSREDLTGGIPQQNDEIFLLEDGEIRQITDGLRFDRWSRDPSLDAGSIAFVSTADLAGANEDGSEEIFLYDGSEVVQVTNASPAFRSTRPRLSSGRIAFTSNADHTGRNPDGGWEVFLYDGAEIVQVTDSDPWAPQFRPSLDGRWLAFGWEGDPIGRNPHNRPQVFLADCPPEPPPGPYLETAEIPGFRFKVRITAAGEGIAGKRVDECIPETLCVSGALAGRSELFVRMIGPRPNGFLWTNFVRFTPSRVELWVEQTATGEVNYYDLPALARGEIELRGLVDQEAFLPEGAGIEPGAESGPRSVRGRGVEDPGVVAIAAEPPAGEAVGAELGGESAERLARRPEGATFTSDEFPGFRFTVRIVAGGEEQPVRVEAECIPETVCVSGALAGRSELFVRIIGPRPNGFLWTNLVRFTTSRVEVEVEQVATGARRIYFLSAVPRGSDELPGRVDRVAFEP